MRQLTRLELNEDETLNNFFIHAQELSTRLEHAREHLSEPLVNSMMLNGLPGRYEHFVVQESFNIVGSFVETRKRLMNYQESRIHWDYVEDVDPYVAMTSRKAKPKHKSSSKNNAPPNSSSGQLTCYMKSHMKSECYKKWELSVLSVGKKAI